MLLLRNGYDCNLFVAFENGVSVVWTLDDDGLPASAAACNRGNISRLAWQSMKDGGKRLPNLECDGHDLSPGCYQDNVTASFAIATLMQSTSVHQHPAAESGSRPVTLQWAWRRGLPIGLSLVRSPAGRSKPTTHTAVGPSRWHRISLYYSC